MFKKSGFKDPRIKRLEMEHQLMKELAASSEYIDFEVVDQRTGMPPDKYLVHYSLKSIIGVREDSSPIYGERHTAQIKLPQGYPLTSAPSCYMKTDAWHPNIKFAGETKGHICINDFVIGHWYTIDMVVKQIGEMLQYKNYHALHILPYPEDTMVASWVRDYAEPRGIVDLKKNIYADDKILIQPTQKWTSSRKKKSMIKILNYRKNIR